MDTTDDLEPFPLFKNIRKPTMKETYQYLVRLAKKEAGRNFQNVEMAISSSSSLPLFDEDLRLMVVDVLQMKNEVIKILLSQEDNQMKRILSCKWFFFDLSSDFCMMELFPFVSVSLRCKIIRQLSKYLKCTKEAEKHFLNIRKKFGTGRAEYLLPRCSPEFILNYFEKYKPMFSNHSGRRSLMKICQRYPEVGFRILSTIFEMKKNQSHELIQYKYVLVYLGGHYPDDMVDFLQKHHSHMNSEFFGKKLSKKLGLRLKDFLIPDYLKGEIIMNISIFLIFPLEDQAEFLATIVRPSDQVLSFHLWRKTKDRFCKFLNLVPPQNRLKLVQLVFQKLYNKNFDDHPICWTYELLEMLPTKSRQSYLRKLEKFFDAETSEFEKNVDVSFSYSVDHREKFIQLFDCDTSIEKFQELLKKSPPVSTRERILSAMVENCKINDDVKGLEKVVEFVAKRHRNDEKQVIYGFINAICDSFRAENLSLKIYETIEDLIYFLRVKGFEYDHVYFLWLERHIYYRLDHGLNVDGLVKSLFESSLLQSSQLYVRDYKSKHTKTLILALWEKARAWILNNSSGESSSKKVNTLIMNMLATCKDYKIRSQQKRIFLREAPGLQELLKKKLSELYRDVGGEEWPVEIWDRYFGNVSFPGYKAQCLYFTLQRNTKLIVDHFSNVLNILFTDYGKLFGLFFIAFMKAISFYGRTEEVMEIILNEFKNGDSLKKRKTALNLYSRVCTIEEFSKAVEDYIPKQTKLDRSDNDFDQIQMAVPVLIKNVKPRWKNFDLISKFMFGDFLKSARLSFSSCCFYTRRDYALPLLKDCLKAGSSNISYQKDVIKVIVEISDRDEILPSLMKFWKDFEDPSIRNFLLKAVSNAFIEQPSEETFKALEECILDCDTSVIYSKPCYYQIPNDFFNDYISALWQFSEKTKPLFRKDFRQDIIWKLNLDHVRLLKPPFCESIIRENLFNPSSDLCVSYFALDYVHADPFSTQERLGFVLSLLKEQKPPSSLFKDFLEALTMNPFRNALLFGTILRHWPECLDGVFFETREILFLHSIYHGLTNATPEELAKELTKAFLNIDGLNNLLVIYTRILPQFLASIGTFKAVRTVKELVLNSPSKTITILAICSVPNEAFKWYEAENLPSGEKLETKKILDEIVRILENRGDKDLRIYRWWKLDCVKS